MVVVGVGDPRQGKFIDGRQSRQDTATLRQIAIRLGGVFHNGNEKHLSSETLRLITETSSQSQIEKLTEREYALIAIGLGAGILALLPLLLHYGGTGWRLGARSQRRPNKRFAERSSVETASDGRGPRA